MSPLQSFTLCGISHRMILAHLFYLHHLRSCACHALGAHSTSSCSCLRIPRYCFIRCCLTLLRCCWRWCYATLLHLICYGASLCRGLVAFLRFALDCSRRCLLGLLAELCKVLLSSVRYLSPCELGCCTFLVEHLTAVSSSGCPAISCLLALTALLVALIS